MPRPNPLMIPDAIRVRESLTRVFTTIFINPHTHRYFWGDTLTQDLSTAEIAREHLPPIDSVLRGQRDEETRGGRPIEREEDTLEDLLIPVVQNGQPGIERAVDTESVPIPIVPPSYEDLASLFRIPTHMLSGSGSDSSTANIPQPPSTEERMPHIGPSGTVDWGESMLARAMRSNPFEDSSARDATEREDRREGTIPDEVPTPADSTPVEGKWPIGTIVKWDLRRSGVKEYLLGLGKSSPLIKIVRYNSGGSLSNFIWEGEVEEDINNTYDVNYFTLATAKETASYQQQVAELCPCTDYPKIGTVLKYIGRNPSTRGKTAVVMAHSRDSRVEIKWLGNSSTDKYSFTVFQVAKSQEGSFVPNPVDYCQCAHCNSMRPLSRTRKVGDIYYCDSQCAMDAGNDYCRECNNWSHREELRECQGNRICNRCYTVHYRECTDCGQFYHRGRMSQTSENQLICSSCARALITSIHDHGFRPMYTFNKMAWENTRYLGVELEVETEGSREELAKKTKIYLKQLTEAKKSSKRLDRLVYMTGDSSLSNGIEIITHPFTLQSFHKHFPIKDFLQFLRDNGAIVQDNCGMHVHVSKDKVSEKSLVNGKWFFHKCEPLIKKFSERQDFHYCEFDSHSPRQNPHLQDSGHYTVFNVDACPKTLEIRVCRSTLDYTKFLANLQFADCVVGYIQRGGNAFLRTKSCNEIWGDFIGYAKRSRQYQVLTNYLLKNSLAGNEKIEIEEIL